MRILRGGEITAGSLHDSVVTVGNFDGVHRGHLEIFRHLNRQGESMGLTPVVVTFDPHPLAVVAPESAPPLITTFAQKTALIAAAGIDCLAVFDFTGDFSRLSAEQFVGDLLCDCLGMRHIIIGHDYAFGRGRRGNFETLARMAGQCDFTLEDLEPVGDGGDIFSSSLVRRRVADGDMPGAAAILGRYHAIAGTVVHGREIGASLGFPTANIETANELIPPDGVYAVMVRLGGAYIQGACSIGVNPTFGNSSRTIEVFLFEFSKQLYGRELEVSFVQRLRDVSRFPDADALIRAITRDVSDSRSILNSIDPGMIRPQLVQNSDGR